MTYNPGIQAVVNNAAINILADVELATMDMYHRVAEVNMFGMIRIAKAFAPLIRKYKGMFMYKPIPLRKKRDQLIQHSPD